MPRRQISIADSVEKRLNEIARKLGNGHVNVGFLEGAKYPDGTGVPEVAYTNEFGDSRQPARPFFRRMVAKEGGAWPDKMAALAKKTDYDGPKILALMGEDIEGALKQSINDLKDPPLSPYTIKKKGFDKPLIDTSHMINSTGYEVKS